MNTQINRMKSQSLMYLLCGNAKRYKILKHYYQQLYFDGMYYEVTYNGDKDEIYFDAYKKFENRCIKVGE